MPAANNSIPAAEIVATARKYLGVRFGHQGRARLGDHGPRMDCVGILFCVGEDLALNDGTGVAIHRFDSCDYGPQPLNEFIHAECKRRLLMIGEFGKAPLEKATERTVKLAAGQVLTLRIPNVISHAAIVTGGEPKPTILYANPTSGHVVETLLGPHRRGYVAGIFEFPGVSY